MTVNNDKRGRWAVLLRSARIISGLFLLAFITTHLLNMVAGLHSIEMMDAMRPYLTGLWTGPIGSKLLMAVLMIHFLLALHSIYWRETLRMSANDLVQLIAGLLIIPLLIPHAIGIGAMNKIFSDAGYGALLKFFWLQDPIAGLRQVLLLGIVWVHGCMGLFVWLRSKEWAVRLLLWLYPIAVAIPVLALLAYVDTGREILLDHSQPKQIRTNDTYNKTDTDVGGRYERAINSIDANKVNVDAGAIVAQSKVITSWILRITTVMVLLTLLTRHFRVRLNRNKIIEVDYIHGPVVTAQSGLSMLDIARHNDLPHANLCHGRGRCGTCRIRVLSSSEDLPPPSELELKTLERLNSGPGVRLACQLSPTGGQLRVERVLPADHQHQTTLDDNHIQEEPA